MKVLFFMRSTVYVRNLESTLRLLAARGHQVHVAAETHQVLDQNDLMGRLCREYPGITHGRPPGVQVRRWSRFGVEVRKALDYLRYLEPEFQDAPKLRQRAESTMPVLLGSRVSRRFAAAPERRQQLRRFLRWCGRGVPPDPAIMDFIRRQRPDLVLVTPLVEPGSPQSDYLRAARALGIPTGLCVYSWDNLTSKGLIHDPVDVVTVWNQTMKDEATTLHRVAPERVVVTGAASYDHWFTWTSRTSREAFCARAGLDPERPYLLYLCSSRFIAPDERPFVRRWIEETRASSAVLGEAGVLVRPHPQNMDLWYEADFSDLRNVAVWPRGSGNPTDEASRADYFDSIAYSAGVVGVNTSALIESAIVGRGVFTVLAPEFRDTQEGTLHFRHLRNVNGGLLHVASDMADHVAQLEAVLQDPSAATERCRRFLEAFVRPYGIGEAATPRVVAALEAAAARGSRRPHRGPWWAIPMRPVLAAIAKAVERSVRAQAELQRQETAAARLTQEARPALRRAAAEVAALRARRASAAFGHYSRVREQVRRQCEAMPANGGLTASEQRMLAALAPLWDAGPETVAVLRQYGAAISGIRAADYEDANRKVRFTMERDVRRLMRRDMATLWVDEPPVLGAFGFNLHGRRFNEDTLRSYRVMSLLEDAALLHEFRGASSRRTVWEIGGGWGGFAYHFKSLCPNVTYLITGRPELFLLSAVYLMTLCPAARFRFYDPAAPDAFWKEWADVDFAFAPEGVVPRMQPPALSLVVDLLALGRMSDARIRQHIQRAYDLEARYFVSVSAPAGLETNGAEALRPALDQLYWLHPVCAPGSLAKRLSLPPLGESVERTYFLGWRRLLA